VPGSAPDPAPPRDPGLPHERTSLAWQRSGVTGSLLGAGVLLAAARRPDPALLVVAAVVAVACAVLSAAVGTRRVSRSLPWPSPWPRLVMTATIPVLIAAVGILLARARD
jgi:uncharacterized membrane protein YoaK (UPF0700 family)